jgi:hypothetical protein
MTVNGMSSRLKAICRARAEAADRHAALPAYDGYVGVISSGVQLSS